MPPIEHSPSTICGDFCWVEDATPDAPTAVAFYGALFGWQEEADVDFPLAEYRLLGQDQERLVGVFTMSDAQIASNLAARWIPFVRVESLQRSGGLAKRLGATLQGGKRALPGVGKAMVLLDLEGAAFALWEADPAPGVDYLGSPGQPCWFELSCRNGEATRDFYAKLFGWQLKLRDFGDADSFHAISNGGNILGGIVEMGEEFGGTPSQWIVYFAVQDCDATTRAAKEMDAMVHVVPTESPEVGRTAVLEDPSGAVFGILEPV